MQSVATVISNNLSVILTALITCLVTGLIAWFQSRSHAESLNVTLGENLKNANAQLSDMKLKKDSLEDNLKTVQQEFNHLAIQVKKYESVQEALRRSRVVRTHLQPVVLVGPRGVGKTSLLMQWHAPWVVGDLTSTEKHSTADVPIYDFESGVEPHFADPEVKVPVDVHLKLKVHDFPGENKAQLLIRQVIEQETIAVREATNKEVGVVVICMFDASEAKHRISESTSSYYHGDLFRGLRNLVSGGSISLQRLILVFNKYDLLRPHFKNGTPESQILEHCAQAFNPVLSPLRGSCSPEKICEVLTIVPRQDMQFNNQGATIVKAEASKGFVEMFVGKHRAEQLLPQRASSIVAAKLGL
jgi:GTPase SAR1 family protein